ncbi:hypothetical protein H0H93_010039, partial [Arthromyces matolae]
QELKVLDGHTQGVTSVAFSSDGSRIVSGSWDKSVRVWDAPTGQELKVLDGHTHGVVSVAFSGDGNCIVSGSFDNSVRVWDAPTGHQLKVLDGHTQGVTSVAFSSDGSRIVSGSWDKSVRVWDAPTGQELKVLDGHTHGVVSVAFSGDGNHIVSGSFDHSVRVWDASTGHQLKVLEGHTEALSSVAFLSDGSHIVSGSYDQSVRVWDVSTRQELTIMKHAFALVLVTKHNTYRTMLFKTTLAEKQTIFMVIGYCLLILGPIRIILSDARLPDSSNILTIPTSAAASVDFTHAFLGSESKWRVLALLVESGAVYGVLQLINVVIVFGISYDQSSLVLVYDIMAVIFYSISFVYPALTLFLIHGASSLAGPQESIISAVISDDLGSQERPNGDVLA